MGIIVPHVAFNADVAESTDEPDPPGYELAEHLRRTVAAIGGNVGDIDDWRDVGWSFLVIHRERQFDIHLAGPDPAWIIAIEPMGQPGFFERLRGAKPVPTGPELRELSVAIHRGIGQLPNVRNISWCLNANPIKNHEASTPDALRWSA